MFDKPTISRYCYKHTTLKPINIYLKYEIVLKRGNK